MPAFQSTFLASNANAFGSCAKRASVDVSAAAEFAPGDFAGAIAEYDATDGWVPSVGTSAASPMVAGLLTRLGLTDAISADLGWVYTNAAAFNDITSGTNDLSGTCTGAMSVMCKAGTGYDGPTGVGSPNATLLAALVAPPDAGDGAGDDGGTTGDDGGPSAETRGASKSGCGCRAGTTPALDDLAYLAAASVLGVVLRRRRARVSR